MTIMTDRTAAGRTVGTFTPEQLFAGEAPVITENGTAGGTYAAHQVLGRNAAGNLVAHDPTAGGGSASEAKAIGIALFAGNASTQTKAASYTGGFFNHEAVVWHASLTTLAQRKAAFAGLLTIKIGNLLG